jgi:hypothetical protein
MLTSLEVDARLADLRSKCEPGSFVRLFGIANELMKIVSAPVELTDPIKTSFEFGEVSRLLIGAINESKTKGLLEADSADSTLRDEAASELNLKLRTPRARIQFLAAVVWPTFAFWSFRMLRRYKGAYWTATLWQTLISAIVQFPALAPLAARLDLDDIPNQWNSLASRMSAGAHEFGFKFIDISGAITRAQTLAWGVLLRVQSVPDDEKLELLRFGRKELSGLTSFMLLSEGNPWRLGEFNELREGYCLSKILREVAYYRCAPIGEDHPFHEFAEVMSASRLYCFKRGALRPSTYVVRFPEYHHLAELPTATGQADWERDAWSFTYKHLDRIAGSQFVRNLQVELAMVDEVVIGLRLEHWMMGVAGRFSEESLAIVIVEALGLPVFCTPMVTEIFRSLFRLLRQYKSNAPDVDVRGKGWAKECED